MTLAVLQRQGLNRSGFIFEDVRNSLLLAHFLEPFWAGTFSGWSQEWWNFQKAKCYLMT